MLRRRPGNQHTGKTQYEPPVEIPDAELADEACHRLGILASQCYVYLQTLHADADAEPPSRKALRIAFKTNGGAGVKAVLREQLRAEKLRQSVSK